MECNTIRNAGSEEYSCIKNTTSSVEHFQSGLWFSFLMYCNKTLSCLSPTSGSAIDSLVTEDGTNAINLDWHRDCF